MAIDECYRSAPDGAGASLASRIPDLERVRLRMMSSENEAVTIALSSGDPDVSEASARLSSFNAFA